MEETIEIFGKRLKIVTDENDSCYYCKLCAIMKLCGDVTSSGVPICKDAEGNVNRHFELVND